MLGELIYRTFMAELDCFEPEPFEKLDRKVQVAWEKAAEAVLQHERVSKLKEVKW
jgi:hypothetical protein